MHLSLSLSPSLPLSLPLSLPPSLPPSLPLSLIPVFLEFIRVPYQDNPLPGMGVPGKSLTRIIFAEGKMIDHVAHVDSLTRICGRDEKPGVRVRNTQCKRLKYNYYRRVVKACVLMRQN